MIQSSTQSNPVTPIAEPNKTQPPGVGPHQAQQTEAEKKALADKASQQDANSKS